MADETNQSIAPDLLHKLPDWAQLAIAGAQNRRAREVERAQRDAEAQATKLLRCPLCGYSASLYLRDPTDGDRPGVVCSSSHCRCRLSGGDALDVVLGWNRRSREVTS